MTYADPEPPGGLTREQHIAACIGCQHIQNGRVLLTCYEMAARARYAAVELSVLFKLYRQPGNGSGDEYVGLPHNGPEMVDAVVARISTDSIDLGKPDLRRWVEPFVPRRFDRRIFVEDEVEPGTVLREDRQGEWAVRCICQLTPTDVVTDGVEAVAAAPCSVCGETQPADLTVFAVAG